jgi:hypothetical protein
MKTARIGPFAHSHVTSHTVRNAIAKDRPVGRATLAGITSLSTTQTMSPFGQACYEPEQGRPVFLPAKLLQRVIGELPRQLEPDDEPEDQGSARQPIQFDGTLSDSQPTGS